MLSLQPLSRAALDSLGQPFASIDLASVAIPSAESVGTPQILAGDIGNAGAIASAEFVSLHALTGPASLPLLAGIASLEAVGSPTLGTALSASTVASAEVVGSPTLGVDSIVGVGVAYAGAVPTPTLVSGVTHIRPATIPTGERFAAVGARSGVTLYSLVVIPPPAVGTVSAKKLCSPFELLRAERYTGAPTPAAILPEVLGDFSLGGLRGPCPTVLVTASAPWVYIAAAHAVRSIDAVYVDDAQVTTGFVASPVDDYQGLGQVATITFDAQPAGQVSWRGKGRMASDGALIENPVAQLREILVYRGGYDLSTDFDATTVNAALGQAAGWRTAWVVADERQIQDWLTEILFNVLGTWRVSGRAQLQIGLDPGTAFGRADLAASVLAARDCVGGDDGVTWTADRRYLVNVLDLAYQYAWSTGEPSNRATAHRDDLSVNAYGELKKYIQLRGHRDPAGLDAFAATLFARQAFGGRVEGALVEFEVAGPALVHATVGDLIAFSWPYGPRRENGNAYVNEILRITGVALDVTRGGSARVTAVDTGAYVTNGAGARLLTPVAL